MTSSSVAGTASHFSGHPQCPVQGPAWSVRFVDLNHTAPHGQSAPPAGAPVITQPSVNPPTSARISHASDTTVREDWVELPPYLGSRLEHVGALSHLMLNELSEALTKM